MTTYKYRQLSSSRDAEAVEALRVELGGDTLDLRRRRAARATAEREAPRAVQAEESEASYHELVRQLREGELKSSDLVFCGGAWTTFATAPDFYEVFAEEDEQAEADGQRTTRILVVVGVILVAFFGWLLFKR